MPAISAALDLDDTSGQAPDDSLEDLLAACPGLADDAWLAAHDPDWADDAGWARRPGDLAGDLAADDAWLDDGPGPPPGPREVLKAGFWDRTRGDGAGFAAGGVLDTLPPGPALAGFARDAWADGLGQLSDDELVGLLRAARRLASWAAALELAAAGDLWRRRTAEEDAGDTGAACHAEDEIAAALTLTGRAGGRVLDLAVALQRLPLTAAALAAGDIDLPRAAVIADEVTGLGGAHAAAVDRAVAAAAPGQTTGQLRAAARRAVLAADPAAARRRKEEALHEARVERWDEQAGTAALAGRDLPPAEVLAADQNLTTLASQLKEVGVPGTLDNLRAAVYLALLCGAPVSSLLPAGPGGVGPGVSPAAPPPGGSPARNGSLGDGALPGLPPGFGAPGRLTARGSVHLTLPLTTWLGQSQAPGQVAGFGALDATDARDLARALANHPDTTWCLTLTGPDGRPAAHGCARSGPPSGRRRTRAGPRGNTRDGPGPEPEPPGGTTAGSRGRLRTGHAGVDTRDPGEPTDLFREGAANGPPGTATPRSGDRAQAGPRGGPAGSRDYARAGPGAAPATGAGAGPGAGATGQARTFTMTVLGGGDCDHAWQTPAYQPTGRAWTFTMTVLGGGDCDHAWQTPAYQPTGRLRHLLHVRHATCTYPGCRRPARQCDQDHTLAYDVGGRTCLCNLAPLCRHHHQVKQALGWALEQASPGVLTWTTPAGRRYTVSTTSYPS